MIDYHVHSVHSGDSPATVQEMCERAVEIGITDIAFTEHLDFTPTDIAYGAFNYDKREVDLQAAREEFSGRLTIRAGIEVDYQTRHRSLIEDYLGAHSFDYVLGSAHYINGAIMEDHRSYFSGKSVRDAYVPYFDAAISVVESGLFDALAHPDLVKRHGSRYFGKFVFEDFDPEIQSLLSAVISKGIILEVNSSGLRQPPEEAYPGWEAILMYKELGGRLVALGSDAHTPKQLGFGLSEVGLMVEQAGLEVFCLGA